MHELPTVFSRWQRLPINPNAPSLREYESPDGLERVLFGSSTGTLSLYRRSTKTKPFDYMGPHPLDPYIGKDRNKR